ncbi:MAG TPA: hypothetical protein VFO54_05265 [Chryseosolibacter sp.]|nr:hypothetical protein [Chryseosolibacter sp.]
MKSSKLNRQITDLCEDVIAHDRHLLFIPQPGKLMALLEILNAEGVAYELQHSKDNKEV